MNKYFELRDFNALTGDEKQQILDSLGPKETLYIHNSTALPIVFKNFDKYAQVIPIEVFCADPSIYDIDGEGYLSTETQQSNMEPDIYNVDKIKEKYPWCTHITWYDENK